MPSNKSMLKRYNSSALAMVMNPILLWISLKFVPNGLINNIAASDDGIYASLGLNDLMNAWQIEWNSEG